MQKLYEKSALWYKGDKSIAIDASRSVDSDLSIITHAHSDHVNIPKRKETNFLVSNGTHSLVEKKGSEKTKFTKKDFGKKITVGNAKVWLENAGHILGSSQVVIETDRKIVFTSDFKMQNSLIMKGAEPIESDILVIESTFGLPEYNFPAREDVYSEMETWIKRNVEKDNFILLSGYSLGKAQELTSIANKFGGVTPLVNEKIFDFNNIYKKHEMKIGNYILLNHNLKESNMLILPPNLIDSTLIHFLEKATGKKVVSAMATGWPYRRFFDRIFNLSDHADFNSLLEYVKQSNPKLVLTQHGHSKQFAASIRRKLKIPAKAIKDNPQALLREF